MYNAYKTSHLSSNPVEEYKEDNKESDFIYENIVVSP